MTTMNNKISLPPISDILNHQPSSSLTYHIPQYHLPNYYNSQPPRPVLPPTSSYLVLPTAPQSHVITSNQAYGGPRGLSGPQSTTGPVPVGRHYSFTGAPAPMAPVRAPVHKLNSVSSEMAQRSIPTSPARSSESSPKFSKASSDEPKDGKRKTRNNLPKETTYILLKWLNEHLNHPYPNSFEKNQLMLLTGLNQQQLSNWFINARRRKIKLLKDQKRLDV